MSVSFYFDQNMQLAVGGVGIAGGRSTRPKTATDQLSWNAALQFLGLSIGVIALGSVAVESLLPSGRAGRRA